MNNPFEALFQKMDALESLMLEIKASLPEETSIKRYSPQDIAENTPLSIHTVREAIKDGRIKAEQFGRKYLITSDEFNRVCKEAKSLKYKRA